MQVITVTTMELERASAACAVFAERLERARAEIADAVARTAGVPELRLAHERARDAHAHAVRAASAMARAARALREAAEDYGRAEDRARRIFDAVTGSAAYALGATGPGFLTVFGALGAAVFAGFLARADVGPQLLRDPRVVAALRLMVDGADEAMLGAARIPLPLALAADDGVHGTFGLHGAASVLVRAAQLLPGRLLEEGEVTVRSAGDARRRAAPDGYGELARRIPAPGAGDPQLRIERYEVPGQDRPRWIVLAGGTVDTGFTPAAEPWDDTSNLVAVAGRASGAIRATQQAMALAGVQPGDEVIPVGYSQGGLVATAIAEDPRYRVPLLVTFGSPTAGAQLQPGTLAVAVEHADDLIPALGGLPRDPDAPGAERVIVRAPSGADAAEESPIAGHALSRYRATATGLDAAAQPAGVERGAVALAAFTAGANGVATLWRADRVPASETANRLALPASSPAPASGRDAR